MEATNKEEYPEERKNKEQSVESCAVCVCVSVCVGVCRCVWRSEKAQEDWVAITSRWGRGFPE